MAAALRAAGWTVQGFDTNGEHARQARELGLIDEATETLDAVAASDAIVLATPVGTIVEQLAPIADRACPSALILDVGSVKAAIVAGMARMKEPARGIGGHPIAGDDRSGPEAARADLLRGASFALCPSAATSQATRLRALELVRDVRALPILIDAEEHDRILARTSHVPQFAAVALARTLEVADRVWAGNGARDMTRLALSDARLWTEVALANADNIAGGLRLLAGQIEELADAIERRDRDALVAEMNAAKNQAAGLRDVS